MGMTLWIHTLEGRNFNKDSDDHSLMHDFSDQLDEICADLGVTPLTSFFDTTDLDMNLADESDDFEEEEGYSDEEDEEYEDDEEEYEDEDEDGEEEADFEADPETGYAYGIDDMKWFDATLGLKTLEPLRDYLASEPLEDLDEEENAMLLEELDDIIDKLQVTAARGGQFNLPVVM